MLWQHPRCIALVPQHGWWRWGSSLLFNDRDAVGVVHARSVVVRTLNELAVRVPRAGRIEAADATRSTFLGTGVRADDIAPKADSARCDASGGIEAVERRISLSIRGRLRAVGRGVALAVAPPDSRRRRRGYGRGCNSEDRWGRSCSRPRRTVPPQQRMRLGRRRCSYIPRQPRQTLLRGRPRTRGSVPCGSLQQVACPVERPQIPRRIGLEGVPERANPRSMGRSSRPRGRGQWRALIRASANKGER